MIGKVMKMALRGTSGRRGACILSGDFTIGAAGAITALSGMSAGNGTAGAQNSTNKTAEKTGRYDIVLDRTYRKVRIIGLVLVGPTDAAFGNTGANNVQARNVTVTTGWSSFQIQGILASTGADTDFVSGTVVHWTAYVDEL